jgi:hypothetical protein
MDWKDIEGVIGNAAPLLGTLIGGPAGPVIGGMIASALGTQATPDAVSQAIAANPDAAVKLRQIESDQATKLRELAVTAENNRLIAETAAVAAVNATMQTEAKADHWPTYSWRPFLGFCVGLNTISASALVLGVFGAVIFGAPQAAAAVTQLPSVLGALAAISATVLPILGVASWYRGKMQADPNTKTDNRG